MSKRSHGLVTFVTGLAAGATAAFLSDKKNRELAQKKLAAATTKAKKVKAEYDKDPKAFQKKITTSGKALAQKALAQAKTSASKNVAKVKKVAAELKTRKPAAVRSMKVGAKKVAKNTVTAGKKAATTPSTQE